MFERDVTSRIRAAGGEAEACFRPVGNDPPIDLDRAVAGAGKGGFDAVLSMPARKAVMSAAGKQGNADAMATTGSGNRFDFLRNDHEEFDEPAYIDFMRSVVLATEPSSRADGQRVGAIETIGEGGNSVGELVDSALDAVVSRLERDGLIKAGLRFAPGDC